MPIESVASDYKNLIMIQEYQDSTQKGAKGGSGAPFFQYMPNGQPEVQEFGIGIPMPRKTPGSSQLYMGEVHSINRSPTTETEQSQRSPRLKESKQNSLSNLLRKTQDITPVRLRPKRSKKEMNSAQKPYSPRTNSSMTRHSA